MIYWVLIISPFWVFCPQEHWKHIYLYYQCEYNRHVENNYNKCLLSSSFFFLETVSEDQVWTLAMPWLSTGNKVMDVNNVPFTRHFRVLVNVCTVTVSPDNRQGTPTCVQSTSPKLCPSLKEHCSGEKAASLLTSQVRHRECMMIWVYFHPQDHPQ